MKFVGFLIITVIVLFTIGLCRAAAQSAPAPSSASAPSSSAPLISMDVRQAIQTSQGQAQALAYAIAVLQKELDATTVELSRNVEKAKAQCAIKSGYELTQTLSCEKVKDKTAR